MATINRYVDGDITAGWDTAVPGGTHYTTIDEGTVLGGHTPSDADYVETTTMDDVDEYTVEDTPANTSQVTSITVNWRGQIDDVSATAKVQLDLFHSSGTPVTGNPKTITGADLGGYGVLGEVAKTWSTLTLTKTQADSLQVRQTSKAT
jgi:hypothetical protein